MEMKVPLKHAHNTFVRHAITGDGTIHYTTNEK